MSPKGRAQSTLCADREPLPDTLFREQAESTESHIATLPSQVCPAIRTTAAPLGLLVCGRSLLPPSKDRRHGDPPGHRRGSNVRAKMMRSKCSVTENSSLQVDSNFPPEQGSTQADFVATHLQHLAWRLARCVKSDLMRTFPQHNT